MAQALRLAIVLFFTFSMFSLASIPNQGIEYMNFLRLKLKAAELNLANQKTKNFIPQDVVWIDDLGAQMVPRPNPFKKVFRPNDPDANHRGTIRLPNIDQRQELESISFAKKELARLAQKTEPKSSKRNSNN